MTYESVLLQPNVKLDLVLIVDGIPVLFGTRAGRTHDGVNVTNPPAGWTSVEAIVKKSIKLGEQAIDWDSMFVQPSKVSMQIASSPAWDTYFDALTDPIGKLIGSIDNATGDVGFDDANAFTDGQYVYLDQETILLGTIVDPTFTGCTRGCIALPGNLPAKHESGDLIYSSPPTMIGRRATLRIYAGHADSDYVDWVGYRIAASPECDPGTISITLDSGMSELAVKMATGFQGCVSDSVLPISGTGGETQYDFRIFSQYPVDEFLNGDDLGQVMIAAPNGDTFICNVEDIQPLAIGPTTAAEVYVTASAFVPSHPNENGAAGVMATEELEGSSIKRVYVSRDYPMRTVLTGLLSREGDGTNSVWDTMVGRLVDGSNPPDDNAAEYRMGAGLDQSLVDLTALEEFKDVQIPGWNWIFGDKPDALALDMIEEAAWALGVIFFWGTNGLSCQKLAGRTVLVESDRVLTETSISRKSSLKAVNDESQVLHTVTVDCNYPPGSDDAQVHVSVIHNRTKRLYRGTPITQAGTLQLQRRGLWSEDSDHKPPLGNVTFSTAQVVAIRQLNQRVFVKRGKPVRRYSVTLPWCNIFPGDRVTLTHTRLRAFDGSYVNGLHCDVTKVARNWNERNVVAFLDEAFNSPLIAPALRVASWNAGTLTLALSTNNLTWGGGTNPATFFAAGWAVEIHDRSSSPPFSDRYATTVVSTDSIDHVVIAGVPTFAPAAGDVVTLRPYDDATAATNTNQAQSARPSDYAFMADANFFLGTANDPAEKWG